MYFCAAFLFDAKAQKLTALLAMLLMIWAAAVQVIKPLGGAAPWPVSRPAARTTGLWLESATR